MKNSLFRAALTALMLTVPATYASVYIQVSPDLTIHYEEKGSGQPIIFIPGWASSTEYMQAQLEHFAKNYRAISYDPRSQGLSSKTVENNHYTQHGKDLKAFLDALELSDVILAAHSNGCYDIYSYVREYGITNIKAVIAIDCVPPRKYPRDETDTWVQFPSAASIEGSYQWAMSGAKGVKGFIPLLVERELTENELNTMANMVMQTPESARTMLIVDGSFADYLAESKQIDQNIPFLYVLAKDQMFGGGDLVKAQAWISKNWPNTKTFVLGKHNMHWEFPDQFNAAVDDFLQKNGL